MMTSTEKVPDVRGFRVCFWYSYEETGLGGWGARIRTWEWRNQNPLPYHLATPQQVPESRGEAISCAAAGP